MHLIAASALDVPKIAALARYGISILNPKNHWFNLWAQLHTELPFSCLKTIGSASVPIYGSTISPLKNILGSLYLSAE